MESNNDFARSLALLRRDMGVSQRTAAKALGISQALLSHYENGAREPGLAFVRRACDYYHVSADFLLGRTLTRDGATIDPDALYDASADRDHTLRGSIIAPLNKKLVVNSVGLLFDLLGKVGSREAVTAAANYLSSAVYQLFRHLYRTPGSENEDFFSISPTRFDAGCARADMIYSEADYLEALHAQLREKGREVFPPMNNDALAQMNREAHQSLLQIIHNTGERIGYNMDNRWKGKK